MFQPPFFLVSFLFHQSFPFFVGDRPTQNTQTHTHMYDVSKCLTPPCYFSSFFCLPIYRAHCTFFVASRAIACRVVRFVLSFLRKFVRSSVCSSVHLFVPSSYRLPPFSSLRQSLLVQQRELTYTLRVQQFVQLSLALNYQKKKIESNRTERREKEKTSHRKKNHKMRVWVCRHGGEGRDSFWVQNWTACLQAIESRRRQKKSTLCGKYLGQLQKKTEMKIMRSRYLPSSKGSTQFRASYGL